MHVASKSSMTLIRYNLINKYRKTYILFFNGKIYITLHLSNYLVDINLKSLAGNQTICTLCRQSCLAVLSYRLRRYRECRRNLISDGLYYGIINQPTSINYNQLDHTHITHALGVQMFNLFLFLFFFLNKNQEEIVYAICNWPTTKKIGPPTSYILLYTTYIWRYNLFCDPWTYPNSLNLSYNQT